jgi:putative MATE family efflux protein
MSENARLTRGSIPGHLVSQTLPAIIGVGALMSIGLVDAYYIGKLGGAELAAVSFIFPISIALTSLGVGVMVGINSVVARALGAGDVAKASRCGNLGIVLGAAGGLLVGLLLFAFHQPLFRLMNADAAQLPLISAYVRPYALGFPLLLCNMAMSGMLRGQGEARRTSLISITYAVTSWSLDPLFILGGFGFAGFGIAGAAYASIAGWAMGTIVAILMMRRTLLPLNLALLRGGRLFEPAIAILRVAGPAAMSNAINPMGLAVLTALVATTGPDAVAAFGTAGRVQTFVLVPLLALSGTIGAIVGQNWGARQYGRARQAALWAGAFCLFWGLATAALLVGGGDVFAGLFTDDPAIAAEFRRYFGIAAWGYCGFGLLIVGNGILNAIDRSSVALLQSATRVFVVMLPFAWFLRGSWGADAIYAAELAANLAGGSIASLMVWRMLRAPRAEPALA